MMEEGFACMLTTQLKGRTVLRICPIHPETAEDDICHTIQRMYQYARALKKDCLLYTSPSPRDRG